MMWPFRKAAPPEQRADYSESAIRAIIAGASGQGPADWKETSAAITAASLVGRSLAVATLEGATADRTGLTSAVLHDLGCAFVMEGEALYRINVAGSGTVALYRVSDWDVIGGPDPATWRYRVTVAGPTSNRQEVLPAEAVFHPRINASPQEPHKGRASIAIAAQSARLAAGVERQLANEANQPSGQVLPAPLGTIETNDLDALKADLRALAGRTSLVPSMASGWIEDRRAGGPADWRPQRLGFNPPEPVATIRETMFRELLAAAGVPPDLFVTGGQTAKREALRQFLHSTLQPMADVIRAEARAKLAANVKFDFAGLYASDVQGRARAFQSMVGGGMDLERAAALSGLLIPDDAAG